MISSILFDVDDTLYDQQQPFRQAIMTYFPEIPCQQLTSLYLRFRVHSDEQFGKVLANEWTLDHFRHYRLSTSLTDLGYAPVTLKESQHFQAMYEEQLDAITIHPAVKDTLDYLAGLPIQIGIITNGPTVHQQKKLDQLQLTQWIKPEHMMISQATGYQKPDIEIFRLAESMFDLDPATTLYIGDNFDNDVIGAKRAGWQALWLNHRERTAPEGLALLPDMTIDCFGDLTAAITTHFSVQEMQYA